MLDLSPQALSGLSAAAEQRFIGRVGDFLRKAVPGLAREPESQLSATIRQLKNQAGIYGMISEQAVAAFALTAAHLGLDFVDRFRGARQILFANSAQEEKAKLLQGFTVSLLKTLGRR